MAMESIWLAFTADVPVAFNLTSTVTSVVEDFVCDAQTDAQVTATSLTNLFLPYLDTLDRCRHLTYLWLAIFWTVQELQSSDTRWTRLIQLVLEIREVQDPVSPGVTEYLEIRGDDSFWKRLPWMIPTYLWFEAQAPFNPSKHEKLANRIKKQGNIEGILPKDLIVSLTAIEWANISAFLACIHTAAPDKMLLD